MASDPETGPGSAFTAGPNLVDSSVPQTAPGRVPLLSVLSILSLRWTECTVGGDRS